MKAGHPILLVALLFFLFGCEQTFHNASVAPSALPDLTISKSREWMEKNPSSLLNDFSILWSMGETRIFEGRPIVVVPVFRPDGPVKIAGAADGSAQARELKIESLVFYRDENQEITASILAEAEEGQEARSLYFFEHATMKLQSIWQAKDQGLTGYSATDSTQKPNAREACGFYDQWVNICEKSATDRNTIPCWQYAGRIWRCISGLPGENPGIAGGPGSGTPVPRNPPTTGGNGAPSPITGLSPYITNSFNTALGQDKLEVLLGNQPSARLLPLLLEANVNQSIHFTREETDYLETFSNQDIEAITNWIRDLGSIEITFVESQIRDLKGLFNESEKRLIREYSGESTAKYRLDVLRYGANAYAATSATHAYFKSRHASRCGACKGNAFKHALFIIFNAGAFGREISRRLGEAHESTQLLDAETLMDKKNNAQGLRIYDAHQNGGAGAFYWGSKVGDSMNRGELVFLIGNQEVSSNTDDPSLPEPF